VLVVAIGLLIFLFVRSTRQRRDEEGQIRDRMLEMEREAHFASAVDRVPISRNPQEVAREIAGLLGEYLSLPVLGVYSVNSSRTELSDLLRSNITSTEASTAPSSLPVSLLAEQSRPARVSLLSLVGRQSPGSSFNEEPITADHNASV